MKSRLIAFVVSLATAALASLAATGEAVAHLPSRHAAGELVAPKKHWLIFLRHRTNDAAAARCRPKPDRSMVPARTVPEYLRTYTIRVELERFARMVTLASVCERARALAWYSSSGAACVHREEGGWDANTGNGYYGGFQADRDFQQTYGGEFYRRWGTANNWPVWAQIVMAFRGYNARGWHPWPNTARECGLL